MAILIADTKLETESDAWYQFYVDTIADISGLPTSRSTGSSYKVKKFARPTSIAYCIEMAAQFALDGNDEWRMLYALRDDVAEALLESVDEIKRLVANTGQSEQNAAKSAEAAKNCALAASNSERLASESQSAAAASAAVSKNNASNALASEANTLGYLNKTRELVNQAAGYAGSATFAFGPDADGVFSFFMREE